MPILLIRIKVADRDGEFVQHLTERLFMWIVRIWICWCHAVRE